MKQWIIPALSVLVLMATCTNARAYPSNQGPGFGVFSQAYLDRQKAKRWKLMCKGGGRYQAMSEARTAGKPDPCKR